MIPLRAIKRLVTIEGEQYVVELDDRGIRMRRYRSRKPGRFFVDLDWLALVAEKRATLWCGLGNGIRLKLWPLPRKRKRR